jgi:hypothetical protein
MSIARDISRQSKKQIVNISSNTSNIDVDGGFSGSTLDVYLNGSKLIQNADYALNGNSGIILTQSAVSGDVIEFVIKTTSNILSIVDTSALVDEAVTFSKLSNSATEADNVQKRTAKAWVNFNGAFGTSPFTEANGGIRSSFNVSSVVDNGTGDYTINFIEPMVDSNFSVAGMTNWDGTNRGTLMGINTNRALSASAFSITTQQPHTYTVMDTLVVTLMVFD